MVKVLGLSHQKFTFGVMRFPFKNINRMMDEQCGVLRSNHFYDSVSKAMYWNDPRFCCIDNVNPTNILIAACLEQCW